MLTLLRVFLPFLLKMGLPLGLLVAAGSFGYGFVSNYRDMAGQIVTLQRDLNLRDSREASFRRMIDRRDAAIGASQCAAQIQKWVKNPDSIPVPFSPFDQLNNLGKNYRP